MICVFLFLSRACLIAERCSGESSFACAGVGLSVGVVEVGAEIVLFVEPCMGDCAMAIPGNSDLAPVWINP